jgi:hypothetical protein
MNRLSQKFNFIEVEKKLQEYWQDIKVYFWQNLENKTQQLVKQLFASLPANPD